MILHAYTNTPEGNWYPWLKNELENRGYEVWVPLIPTMESKLPDLEAMLKMILKQGFVDKNTVVIGHSLGSVLTLRLAEQVKFEKGILLAGWDMDDLDPRDASFWKNKLDHEKIKANVPMWIVPISDNDPYVSVYMTERMAERLGGKAIKMGKKGHFCKDDGVKEVKEILEFV